MLAGLQPIQYIIREYEQLRKYISVLADIVQIYPKHAFYLNISSFIESMMFSTIQELMRNRLALKGTKTSDIFMIRLCSCHTADAKLHTTSNILPS